MGLSWYMGTNSLGESSVRSAGTRFRGGKKGRNSALQAREENQKERKGTVPPKRWPREKKRIDQDGGTRGFNQNTRRTKEGSKIS